MIQGKELACFNKGYSEVQLSGELIELPKNLTSSQAFIFKSYLQDIRNMHLSLLKVLPIFLSGFFSILNVYLNNKSAFLG